MQLPSIVFRPLSPSEMLKTESSATLCRGTTPRPPSIFRALASITPHLIRSKVIIEMCHRCPKIQKIWRRKIHFNPWSPPDFKNTLSPPKKVNWKISHRCCSRYTLKATSLHLSSSARKYSLLCCHAWANALLLIITTVVTSCTIKLHLNWVNRAYPNATPQSCPTSAKYQRDTDSSR